MRESLAVGGFWWLPQCRYLQPRHPDDFKFFGPISHIQQQIGNAVPPLLAKAVFLKIIEYQKEYERR